jgi:hypothetical protein
VLIKNSRWLSSLVSALRWGAVAAMALCSWLRRGKPTHCLSWIVTWNANTFMWYDKISVLRRFYNVKCCNQARLIKLWNSCLVFLCSLLLISTEKPNTLTSGFHEISRFLLLWLCLKLRHNRFIFNSLFTKYSTCFPLRKVARKWSWQLTSIWCRGQEWWRCTFIPPYVFMTWCVIR